MSNRLIDLGQAREEILAAWIAKDELRALLALARTSMHVPPPDLLLTAKQFRFAFGNAVSETESAELYETYSVPGSGRPLFSAATANLNPSSQATVDTRNPNRGPMLLISGQRDNTVPWAIANASFRRQGRNSAVTEITEMHGRGHSLVIDSGWREVADTALAFVQQHVPKTA